MFHRERDASKVALVGLVTLLSDDHAADRLIDVQWSTPHLASLGVTEVSRAAYLRRLPAVLAAPTPSAFDGPHGARPPSMGHGGGQTHQPEETP
jgi:leucyl/phenylalanyl-tRNA--protein transferase